MKRLTILFAFFPLFSFAQFFEDFPTDNNGYININNIVEVDLEKKQIYDETKILITKLFGNPSFITYDNLKDRLIGTGYFPLEFLMFGIIEGHFMGFTFEVEIKDGRFRYQIYDIHFKKKLNDPNITAEECFDKSNYFRFGKIPKKLNKEYYLGMVRSITYIENAINEHFFSDDSLDSDW